MPELDIESWIAEIRQVLTKRRLALGISQQQLADRINVTQTQVSAMERGIGNRITLPLFAEWAAALDVNVKMTLEYDETVEAVGGNL